MLYTHTIGRIGKDCQVITGTHGTFMAVDIAVDDAFYDEVGDSPDSVSIFESNSIRSPYRPGLCFGACVYKLQNCLAGLFLQFFCDYAMTWNIYVFIENMPVVAGCPARMNKACADGDHAHSVLSEAYAKFG